jgi:hypothetical protein
MQESNEQLTEAEKHEAELMFQAELRDYMQSGDFSNPKAKPRQTYLNKQQQLQQQHQQQYLTSFDQHADMKWWPDSSDFQSSLASLSSPNHSRFRAAINGASVAAATTPEYSSWRPPPTFQTVSGRKENQGHHGFRPANN